ncbi:unnamed protein product [Adineta ricciae]|uniref:Uncharacterized protein n=1 Tax=Adineta ricciae TaxID=249248 RepID=A0A814G4J6_ADIRI|nr:unnamed protein product [Adineta ricciae]
MHYKLFVLGVLSIVFYSKTNSYAIETPGLIVNVTSYNNDSNNTVPSSGETIATAFVIDIDEKMSVLSTGEDNNQSFNVKNSTDESSVEENQSRSSSVASDIHTEVQTSTNKNKDDDNARSMVDKKEKDGETASESDEESDDDMKISVPIEEEEEK